MLQLVHKGCSYTYPPLSIARYSFKQLIELEQCKVNKLAQGFNTAAQDLNPGSFSRESKAIALYYYLVMTSTHCTGNGQDMAKIIINNYVIFRHCNIGDASQTSEWTQPRDVD